jgi:VanZ family protein
MITFFEKHNKLSWSITIAITIIIFILSSITFGESAGTTNINSMLYHLFAFFFLGFFLLISLLKGKNNYPLFLIGILLASSYGILDEIHQFFVPGRFCSIFDICLDTTGIIFSGMIYFIRIKMKNNPKS